MWHPAFQQNALGASAAGNFTSNYMNNELYAGKSTILYCIVCTIHVKFIKYILIKFIAQHAAMLAMQNAEYGQALQQMGFPQSLPQVLF